MGVKVVTDNPKILRTIIESIATNLTEGIYFEFTDSGLQIMINIAGSVWAVEAKISKEKFSKYEVSDNIVLHFKFKELSDFLKTTGPSESLAIEMEDDSGMVKMALLKENMERSMMTGLLPVDEKYRFKGLANFTNRYKGTFTISTSLYQESIKTVALGGSHITCTMDANGITLVSKGVNKHAEVNITKDNEDIQNYKFEESSPIVSHFGVDYLMNLTKFGKISEAMLVCLGTRAPILCIFGNEDIDHVAVAIAPRNE